MAYGFLLHALRGFTATVLLLQSHPASRSSAPCPQEHCIYLPITTYPPVVTITKVTTGGDFHYGHTFAFGEVINNSNSPVYNVVVQATFQYGSNNATFTNTTLLTATFPGQANLFNVYPLELRSYVSDAKVLSWDITPKVSLANLTIVASRAYTLPIDGPPTFPNFFTIVTGVLRNDTNTTLKDVQLYVWNVNKAISNRQTISQVSSSATIVFTTSLFDSGLWQGVDPSDTIRIVAQGIVSP